MNILLVIENKNQLERLLHLAREHRPDCVAEGCANIVTAVELVQQARPPYHTILLDTEFTDGSGIEFAGWLRTLPEYRHTWLLFLTADRANMARAINDVHCYSYLLRPCREEEAIENVLETLHMRVAGWEQPVFVSIDKKGMSLRLEHSDILYAEIAQKNIDIHTTGKVIHIPRFPLKKLMELLPNRDFVQCHRSFVVSRAALRSYESKNKNTHVTLSSGERIPVGTIYREAIQSLIRERDK